MKRFKSSILALVIVLLASVTLFACGNSDAKDVENAVAELKIGFTAPDTADSVTQDITLDSKVGDVVVTWESSEAAVISTAGKVVRQDTDKTVKLTATLTKGKETDKKEFSLKVIKKVVDNSEQLAKDALIAHYETTLGNAEWKATENVDLVSTISGKAVTWEVVAGGDNFTLAGVVTRPSFTEGDATVHLRATIGTKTQNFFFVVSKLDQTKEEKINVALNLVTIVPATPSGYQETHFAAVETVKIDDTDVDVVWESSDLTAMDHKGQLVIFAGEEDKIVQFTATITYQGVTESKTITFKIKPTTPFDNIALAFVPENVGEKIYIKNVSVFNDISSGYYLVSDEGTLAYINGTRDNAKVPKGKLFDVVATVDNYFGSFQLKNIAVIGAKDATLPAVAHPLKTFAEITSQTLPGDSNIINHFAFTLENVKVYVDPGKEVNYNTYLVPVDFNPTTDVVQKDNAIMVYYPSKIATLRALDGALIDSIKLTLAGYRSDKLVWYVAFFDNPGEIEVTLTDAQALEAAESTIKADIKKEYVENKDLTFRTTEEGVNIVWVSDKPTVINVETGKLTVPEGVVETVTLTATLTKGTEAPVVVTITVKVGVPELTTIDKVIQGAVGSYFQVKGTITAVSGNQTLTVQDTKGALTIYVGKDFDAFKAALGKEVTLLGVKDVYNGLNQLKNFVNFTFGDTGATYDPVNITAQLENDAQLLKSQNKLVIVENAFVVKHSIDKNRNVTVTLEVNGKQIAVRSDNRVIDEASNPLVNLVVGQKVTINGAPLVWFNGPQIGFSDAAQITAEPVTDATKLAYAQSQLRFIDKSMGTRVVDLPATGQFDTTVTWTADLPLVAVIAEGKVTFADVQEKTAVVFTATLTLGTETLTKTFVVQVSKYSEAVLNVETFDTSNATSTYGEYTFTGVDGVVWAVVHGRDEDAASGNQIDGKGIMLRRADNPSSLTGTFANGINSFSFEYRKAFTGGTERTYKVDVTANGTTVTYDIPGFASGSGADDTVHTFSKDGLGLSGEVVIRIYAVGANGNQQATFDNFEWTNN